MTGAMWGAVIVSAFAGALAHAYQPRIWWRTRWLWHKALGHHRKADEVP